MWFKYNFKYFSAKNPGVSTTVSTCLEEFLIFGLILNQQYIPLSDDFRVGLLSTSYNLCNISNSAVFYSTTYLYVPVSCAVTDIAKSQTTDYHH